MSDTVLQVRDVSKYYRLGQFNNGTLAKDIQSWYAVKRGKEDPNATIDSTGRKVSSDGFWALKDINFDIQQGERIGIIGKNGAGKSTLLKLISQITAPTTGEIKIKGRVASLLEVGTGFHPEMTGRENIYLNGAILGMKRSEIDRKLDEIIDFSEIEEHIDTPVKRYSSGMYVRLAFAVAAHLDSEILIADEVLAVGDAAFQKKALGKMNEISTNQGRTVLFVSHNMQAIRKLCSTGILLANGKVVSTGTMNEVINQYVHDDMKAESTGTGRFVEDETKEFQLLSIKAYDQIGNQDCFESQRKIYVTLECISRKPLPRLYCYIAISNQYEDNMIVFDTSEQKSDLLSNHPEGKCNLTFAIPEGMLAAGEYKIYVDFGSELKEGFSVDVPGYCCSFTVVDNFSKRGATRPALTSYIPTIVEETLQ